jgi:hypothetical protein
MTKIQNSKQIKLQGAQRNTEKDKKEDGFLPLLSQG